VRKGREEEEGESRILLEVFPSSVALCYVVNYKSCYVVMLLGLE
jgi:hypothetical protein